MNQTARALWHATPVLACRDIDSTLAWYRDVLGFEAWWRSGEPATDASVRRNGASLNFMTDAELAGRVAGSEVMVFVSGVDALYAEHRAKGAPIASPLTDEPWGLREYTVTDPSGYLLRFAEGRG
ncbi:MAG: VOC family protein [Bauldia sp.]|nr:VOC family protein [Bauldia sp.]